MVTFVNPNFRQVQLTIVASITGLRVGRQVTGFQMIIHFDVNQWGFADIAYFNAIGHVAAVSDSFRV